MRHAALVLITFFSFIVSSAASTTVTPTTTLAAETGNNTSAADTFKSQSNGNLGATNVSKMPIRSLLYNGSTTKIYVHLMGWFGGTNHMNIGYDSADPAQVASQVADMMSRGVDGAILDWYGPNGSRSEKAGQLLRKEAEKTSGKFTFAIMEDSGALKTCAATSGCNVTTQIISDLTYAYQQYETSSAYVRVNGRPVVFFFGTDAYTIDWVKVRASVPGNPMFIFRNSGSFAKSESDGGFSWVGISSTSMGLGYLDGFYKTALSYPNEIAYGSGYKGFNDTLASWGANRKTDQQCGQTWLASMAEAGKYYSATKQLPGLQIVTWNDYEEATEIESGIENCVSVSGSVAGNTLSWNITGQESTIDHYTVFISTDGQNLMPVADVKAGTHLLDLAQFGFAADQYTIYVKAVGKATLRNHMSAAIGYSLSNKPPVAQLAVTPNSGIQTLTVSATTAGSSDPDGTIASTRIDFGDGAVFSGTNATHTYTAPGSYTVTATVTDNNGASSSATAAVSIAANKSPLARLTATPATGAAPVVVTASTAASTDSDGSITASSIDFGEGMTANGSTASHTYNTPGTYTVTGTVTDNLGAKSTATATITVTEPANAPPVAALKLSSTTAIAPATISASTAGSSDSDGSIASTYINWGDGTGYSGPSDSHVYTKAGSYIVTATVTDNKGAVSTSSATVTVNWGVAITSPVNNATVTSSTRVTAAASSNLAITAMRIYVDYVSVYLVNNSSKLDTTITLAKGTHRVVVQSWDSAGVVRNATVFVTVP